MIKRFLVFITLIYTMTIFYSFGGEPLFEAKLPKIRHPFHCQCGQYCIMHNAEDESIDICQNETVLYSLPLKNIFGINKRTDRSFKLSYMHPREDKPAKSKPFYLCFEFEHSIEKDKAHKAISQVVFGADTETERKKELFVIVNPYSGGNNGEKAWNKIAQLLDDANLKSDVHLTTAPGHAEEMTRDLLAHHSAYDGVLVVSGDGTLNEAVNGLVNRGQQGAPLPVMVIPGGTGNAIATNFGILNEYQGALCVVQALRAPDSERKKLNLYRYSAYDIDQELIGSGVGFVGVHSGIINDVDIRSNFLRPLGIFREKLWGVVEIVRNRSHPVKVTLTQEGRPAGIANLSLNQIGDPDDLSAPPSMDHEKPEEEIVETIEGDFNLMTVLNVSSLGQGYLFAPGLGADNPEMHFIYSLRPETGLINRFKILLEVADGSYLEIPSVKRIKKITEVSFESYSRQNIFTIDGEVLPPDVHKVNVKNSDKQLDMLLLL